jgi:hypothetical protein
MLRGEENWSHRRSSEKLHIAMGRIVVHFRPLHLAKLRTMPSHGRNSTLRGNTPPTEQRPTGMFSVLRNRSANSLFAVPIAPKAATTLAPP